MADFASAQRRARGRPRPRRRRQAAAAQAAPASRRSPPLERAAAHRRPQRRPRPSAARSRPVTQAADDVAAKRAEAGRAADARRPRRSTLRGVHAIRARNVGVLQRRAAVRAVPGAHRDPLRAPSAAATARSTSCWVRIYPDDCSIDTFEEMLSTTELANAKLYWQGDLPRRRHRGRRARRLARAWSRRTARAAPATSSTPTSRSTCRPPDKAAATDEILVIADADAARARPRRRRIATYWQAVWLADGDARRSSRAARAALDAAVGAARAAELDRRLRAVQPRRPAAAAARQDGRRAVDAPSSSSRPTR